MGKIVGVKIMLSLVFDVIAIIVLVLELTGKAASLACLTNVLSRSSRKRRNG